MNLHSRSSPLWLSLLLVLAPSAGRSAETVAFWAFDEPVGIYPSSVLSDQGPGDHALILGPGGSVVAGRFGNALSARPQPEIDVPEGSVLFGLTQAPTPQGRTVPPLSWHNARFAALITTGENHLRKEFTFLNATRSGLNLGAFDWTVEFWFKPDAWSPTDSDGIVFEVGEGPRGENRHVTSLALTGDRTGFVLRNRASGSEVNIASDSDRLRQTGAWVHLAFTYDAGRQRLRHYLDGREQKETARVALQQLDEGEEAYFTLLRDGHWLHPLPGAIDEFRVSQGLVPEEEMGRATSLVPHPDCGRPAEAFAVEQPLLFPEGGSPSVPINLGSRKHLLIDDSLFSVNRGVTFRPVPPQQVELVYEVEGSFRKHLTVVEDEEGMIRIYNPIGREDRLGVRLSRDGVNFEIPDLTDIEKAYPNITIADPVGTPSVFIDPLGSPNERWKMVSGYAERGIFLYTSPDGYAWTRCPTAVLPAWSGSQSNMFFDDQRGTYVGYHRSDMGDTPSGKTERRFVMTEVEALTPPWPFAPVSQEDYHRAAETSRLDSKRPWYVDNGPLTPGGIGIEYPTVFTPNDNFDPVATDIYVPKAVKYPWAPDAYFAFPCMYFHYQGNGPATRQALGEESRRRGSGPIEIQLMTSRDGVNWTRYPRPVWHGVGEVDGLNIHQTYIAHGMVRRGEEIWMYSFDTEEYHSSVRGTPNRKGVFRLVSPVDRLVAAESAYDEEAELHSRPLVFAGKRLSLNVDTGATGYLQVGLTRGDGRDLPGYGVDDCIYVNGNESDTTVEWLDKGTDLSALAGQSVRLSIRMRGSRLYSLQFTD